MQSSLLALALANRFFQDPLVGVPPAISVSKWHYTNSPLLLLQNFFLENSRLSSKESSGWQLGITMFVNLTYHMVTHNLAIAAS